MKKTYHVTELDCAVCAGKVEKAVRNVQGVKSASLNFVTLKLTLEADDDEFDAVLQRVKEAVPRAERGCSIY